MLGSRLGFSGSVDRMAWHYLRLEQIQDGGRPLSWKMSNGRISATGYAIHFVFGSVVGFSGRRIECLYFNLDQIQDRLV